MHQDILDYLETQRVGVFAIKMLDGSVHGATLHFAHIENPFTFIFLTSPHYRKCEPLRENKTTPASFVVGTDEGNMQTLQLDGTAQLDCTDEMKEVMLAKFPDKQAKHLTDIYFTFAPTWWRFTDWTRPEGKTIYTSDGKIEILG